MPKVTIKAETRTRVGKPSRPLLDQDLVPAVIYGHDFPSRSIQVGAKEFSRVYAEAGESSLVYVDLDGQSLPVLIYDVARDTVSDQYLHADFYKVNLSEKVSTHVPLVFKGEAPAVKDFSGIFVKNTNEVEVEALPQNLPHEIIVDISGLVALGDEILIKDIIMPEGVKIKGDLKTIIALVQAPLSQEDLDKQLATEQKGVEEVEVIKKEKEETVPAETTEKPAK